MDWLSASPILVTLSSRVAALEALLVKGHAEKAEAERANQYILRAQVESAIKDAVIVKNNQAGTRLRYKLVRSREENRTLKAKLRLVTQLLTSHYGSSNDCMFHSKASRRLNVEKVQKREADEDLIDLLSASEPTAVDLSENDAVSCAQPKEEEEGGIDAYEGEISGPQQKRITSHVAVDLSHNPYIYRFGHGNGNDAPSIDSGREKSPSIHLKNNEKVKEILMKSRNKGLKTC